MTGGMQGSLRLALFVAATATLLVLVGMASNVEPIEFGTSTAPNTSRIATSARANEATELPELGEQIALTQRRNAELPRWLLWFVGVAGAVGVLWLLTKQRMALLVKKRRLRSTVTVSPLSDQAQADAIADFATDLIDELGLGPDPRIAIQRAYAAVETGFGSRELRRKPAETPLKYLDRIFGHHEQAAPALARLTDLFQQARFSSEPVDETMRADAVRALRDIANRYRAVGRAKIRR